MGEEDKTYEILGRELQKLKDPDIYIDVGACIGDTVELFLDGVCFAFEPSDRNYCMLYNRIISDGIICVIPIHRALYDKSLPYKIKEHETIRGMDDIEIVEQSDRTTTTIDEFFKGILNIKIIKIDAETTSDKVLLGAKETIIEHKPIIIIEYNHTPNVKQILEDWGYSIEIIDNLNLIARPKNG